MIILANVLRFAQQYRASLIQRSKVAVIRCTLANMLARFEILVKTKSNAKNIANVKEIQDAVHRLMVISLHCVVLVVSANVTSHQQLTNAKMDALIMVKCIFYLFHLLIKIKNFNRASNNV